MNVSPKILLSQLVKTRKLLKLKLVSMKLLVCKDIPIIDYLHRYTGIQRIEIVKAQAEIERITYIDLKNTNRLSSRRFSFRINLPAL